MNHKLEVTVNKWRTLGLLIITVLLVGAAYFCTTQPGLFAKVAGWIGVGFFSLGFVAISIQLFRNGPQVIIDERGIEDRRGQFGLVEWADISSIHLGEISGQKFLCVEISDLGKYSQRLSNAAKMGARNNRVAGCPEFTLGFAGLSHSTDEVMRFIQEHHAGAIRK